MYLKYGNSDKIGDGTIEFQSYTSRTAFSPRGDPMFETRRLHYRWAVKASGQAAVNSAIDADFLKFDIHGRDFGLYQDDDTRTVHFLDSSQSINGTRIIGLNAGENEPAQFATQRILEVIVEADFDVLSTSGLFSFEENITIIGDNGPRHVWHEVLNGPPIRQTVATITVRRALQRGSAVGILAYPTAPPPKWPQYLVQPSRVDGKTSPGRVAGATRGFPITWSYEFVSNVPLFGFPTRR